jgi:hypothetical protein
MKVNVLISTKSGAKFVDYSPQYSSITGEETHGPVAPEDEIIDEIDESRQSIDKFLAVKFLAFLKNRRLTMEMVKLLSPEEQQRLKREFIDG